MQIKTKKRCRFVPTGYNIKQKITSAGKDMETPDTVWHKADPLPSPILTPTTHLMIWTNDWPVCVSWLVSSIRYINLEFVSLQVLVDTLRCSHNTFHITEVWRAKLTSPTASLL